MLTHECPSDTGPDGTGLGFGWLDWELVENDNPAVAVSFTSFLVALCIALTGARTPANIEDDFFEVGAAVCVYERL